MDANSDNTLNNYLKASEGDNITYAQRDLTALILGSNPKSTPGSPTQYTSALGFASVRTSPQLGPAISEAARHSFTNLAALSQYRAPGFAFESASNSAVQSATASPTQTPFGRQQLMSSMANLNMSQLPPTANLHAVDQALVDTSGMFSNASHAFAHPGEGSMLGGPSNSIMARPSDVSPEFQQRVEEVKARGLRLELDGVSRENAKSRVETQIKTTLRLTTNDGERVTCWSHLQLPELLVARDKHRHRLQTKQQQAQALADGSMPAAKQHVVRLEALIKCSSDPTREVETCRGCINREYKRSLRRKDTRMRGTYSTCTTPGQSRAASPTLNGGTMEADWDDSRIALEKKRIVIFNCNDMLDFSKGEVVLPARITCYCRHHMEKVGFCIYLTLYDSDNRVLASHVSPPIMITDDHKSTKFKSDRSKTRAKHEYERAGGGSAAYANHALSGMNSPTGPFSGMGDGLLGARTGGGRQALSARNSPTLRPNMYPYNSHNLLDTYSQFASLAGTPSLGNTPLGSPMLSAAHLGGFETPFHLPPQQSMALANYTGSNSQAILPISPIYSTMQQSNALGLQQPQPQFGDAAGLMSQLGPPVLPEPIQIGQLLPKNGPSAGGVRVMITGRGFHSNIEVYFGASKAGHVRVDSPTVITCVLPPSRVWGSVALRISDTVTRAVHEVPGPVFTYDEDADKAMVELGLQILGVKDSEVPVRLHQDAELSDIVRALLSTGKTPNLVNLEQLLVNGLWLALSRSLLEPQQLAQRHEPSGRTLLHFAAYLGMCGMISFLVQQLPLANEVDNNGMTALHFGCLVGRNDVVEMLLGAGAVNSIRSSVGQTPSDVARAQGHMPLVLLVEGNDSYLNFIEDDQGATTAPGLQSVVGYGATALPWSGQVSDASFAMAAVPAMFAQQGVSDAQTSDPLLASNSLFSAPHYDPPAQ
ncbi:SPT3 Dosage dependent suppressor of Ty-induced promoter mutations-like protein [Coemansia sp. RSA 2131]|nr:SPT3 Dosage dependent suppressor of Ty-induced promoter mutations-like protein [Coemansia sp. RSA 2131]